MNNKKSDTSWTKLPVTVDLKRYLTRQILIEKYHPDKSKEIEMTEFFISKLHDCELFTHNEYQNTVFFIKKINNENVIFFEKDEENQTIYIRYSYVWSIFEKQYGLNYTEIQLFTQSLLEGLLKLQGYKTENQSAKPLF